MVHTLRRSLIRFLDTLLLGYVYERHMSASLHGSLESQLNVKRLTLGGNLGWPLRFRFFQTEVHDLQTGSEDPWA
jgi:hypothetical protein